MELDGSSPHSSASALMSLSWARSVQSTSPYPISWRCIFRCGRKIAKRHCLSSACLAVCMENSAPSGRIFMKFDICFSKTCRGNSIHWNPTRIMGTLHEDQYAYFIVSRWILRRMRNVQTKVVQKVKTHFMFNNFFFRKSSIYEMWWKNMVQPDRPQMTI